MSKPQAIDYRSIPVHYLKEITKIGSDFRINS